MTSHPDVVLYHVDEDRITVRTRAHSWFIGTLFKKDRFYSGHRFPNGLQAGWAWGYAVGDDFEGFGWVSFNDKTLTGGTGDGKTHLNTPSHAKYARLVGQYTGRKATAPGAVGLAAGFAGRQIALTDAANRPTDPDSPELAVVINKPIPFYLNRPGAHGTSRGRAAVPATITPEMANVGGKNTVRWRYTAAKKLFVVQYRPPGRAHGYWGFIMDHGDGRFNIPPKPNKSKPAPLL